MDQLSQDTYYHTEEELSYPERQLWCETYIQLTAEEYYSSEFSDSELSCEDTYFQPEETSIESYNIYEKKDY